ncbi:MAG: DNA translocase FtsK, partial [Ruminococcus sp.]|nr:DNA translocase FtsK [Ruminococcus sp.]
GGAVSALFAGPLLAGFGRMGAAIVIVLMIFVVSVLFSGKELSDLLYALLHPVETSSKLIDKIAVFFISEDEEDSKHNKDDKNNKGSKNNKDKKDNKNNEDNRDNEDNGEEENSSFNIHMPSDNYAEAIETLRNTPKPIPAVTDDEMNEQDELSVFFGDAVNFRSLVSKTSPKPPKKKENENTSELDKLISREAEKKQIQNDLVPVRNTEKSSSDIPEKEYQLPDIELLTKPDNLSNSAEAAAEMREKADKIVNTFKSFGVEVSIKDIYRGPTITRYEIQPGVGVKVSKIRGLEDDIALSLAAHGVRIEAPVPGKAAVGIEVPNVNKDTVTLYEILHSSGFRNAESKLAFAVGKDITGNAIIGDITKMPHVIIAGTTGSGKSVCTRSIIMSILYNAKPDEVKMILIDPKVVEFKVFENLPHLLIPIVTDVKKAAGALNWAVNEMMRRYNTFADSGVNDLKSYNEFAKEEEITPMPQVVVFIDELADMMLVAGKDVEDSICRLAQMGRAAGIHLVVATQRPTTDVITGLIKANIPSRIALSVKSQIDSRTIIDMGGADKLLGNGDMLYMPIGVSKPVRIQGCFASSKDINNTLDFIRSQATGEYDQNILDAVENFVPQTKGDHGSISESGFDAGSDEDYIIRGAEVAVNAGQVSTTLLQRKLKLGYARASRIMDALEERGIVGPAEGAKPRKVLMSKLQYDEWKMRIIENK